MSQIGLKDLIEALAVFQRESNINHDVQAAIGDCLGYTFSPPEAQAAALPQTTTHVSAESQQQQKQTDSIEETVSKSHLSPVPFLRVVGLIDREIGSLEDDISSETTHNTQHSLEVSRPLFLPEAPAQWASSNVAPHLYYAMSESHQTCSPDIDALIRDICRAKPLLDIPRRTQRRAVAQIRLVIDTSRELAPAWPDGHMLALWFKKWCPPDGFEVVMAPWGSASWPAPEPGLTTIVVSDAGFLTNEDHRDPRWRTEGRRRQLGGERAMLWLLTEPDIDKTKTLRGWTRVFRPLRRVARVENREEHVECLLALATLALQVESDLLREFRISLGLSAGDVELYAWNQRPTFDYAQSTTAQWDVDRFISYQKKLVQAAHPPRTWLTPEIFRRALEALVKYRVWKSEEGYYFWVSKSLWSSELGYLRALSQEMPPLFQEEFERFYQTWAHVHVEGLERLKKSASRSFYGEINREHLGKWFERLKLYTPKSSWSEPGGPFHSLAAALAATADVRKLHLQQSPEGLCLSSTLDVGSPIVSVLSGTQSLNLETQNQRWTVRVSDTPLPLDVLNWRSPPSSVDWAHRWAWDSFGFWAEVDIKGVPLRMRWIAPGTFWMGSPEGEPGSYGDERPRHQVRLTEGFWLAETPCTQALWEAITGQNPSRFKSPERPVERVSWDDIQETLKSLNAEIPELELRLPTEAQWEYACRAGTETAIYTGPLEILGPFNAPALDAIAWYRGNSGHEFDLEEGEDSSDWDENQYNHNTFADTRLVKAGTRLVKQKAPNPWGLYDMLGNVWEWCQDYWSDNYDVSSDDPIEDPQGPIEGVNRVLRGGSWYNSAQYVRAAYRGRYDPAFRYSYCGFRLSRGHGAPSQGGPSQEEAASKGGGPGSKRGTSATKVPDPRLERARPSRVETVRNPFEVGLDMSEKPTWAKSVELDSFGVWANIQLEASESVLFRMRWCPPGAFWMGSPDSDKEAYESEKPRHRVRLTEGFWLAEKPCTQAIWKALGRRNLSEFKGAERPVEGVSWESIQKGLKALNERLPGFEARLPTEAQWEYACRAGTDTPRYGALDEVAWYSGNSGGETHPVGLKMPNPWGFYDMLGNVWEWCQDGLRDYSTQHSASIETPLGPIGKGVYRVLRGGGWGLPARFVRAAYRVRYDPARRYSHFGFRLSRGHGAPSQGGPSQEIGEHVPQTSDLMSPASEDAGPKARSLQKLSSVILLTDQAEAHLDIFEKPSWAESIGRDRYGLFAEIELEAFVPVTFRMRWLPPGEFWMGSPETEEDRDDDENRHLVRLTEGFWLAETPCTQVLWLALTGNNPSDFRGAERPVESVSWEDVQAGLETLNKRLPGFGGRLPTEAQWEYACRAGTDTRYGALDEVAWYDGNSNGETHPVGLKVPNSWGLYDTLGNVAEWCQDGYGPYHHQLQLVGSSSTYDRTLNSIPLENPLGSTEEGVDRVLRGGSWSFPARHVRAANRSVNDPALRDPSCGFRLSCAAGSTSGHGEQV